MLLKRSKESGENGCGRRDDNSSLYDVASVGLAVEGEIYLLRKFNLNGKPCCCFCY
jgi:hypothetical protein